MYALYKKKQQSRYTYEFEKEISLFGCNSGFIIDLLKSILPADASERYEWHLNLRCEVVNHAKCNKRSLLLSNRIVAIIKQVSQTSSCKSNILNRMETKREITTLHVQTKEMD